MKTFAKLGAALAACVMLWSCGGGGTADPAPGSGNDVASRAHLRGFVTADDPLVGSSLRLLDGQGTEVPLKGSARTSATGAFVLKSAGTLPLQYTVVASGGTLRGKPMVGELRATVASGRSTDVLYVTPVSTVIAAVAARRGLSAAAAEDLTEKYLGMPAHHALRDYKTHQRLGFSARAFLSEAQASGGLDAFLSQVTGEVASGARRGFAFADGRLKSAATAEARKGRIEDILKVDPSTAATVLQWAAIQISKSTGNDGFTDLLSSVGPAQVPAELAVIQQRISQLADDISQLNSQVQTVGSEIKCAVGQYGYDGIVSGYVPLLAQLRDAATNMDVLAGLDVNDSHYAAQRQYVQDAVAQMTAIHETVQTVAVGSSALDTNGAIRNLSKKLTDCGKFVNPQKSKMIATQFQYWVSAQVSACQLVISYRKGLGLAPASVADAVDACTRHVASLASGPLAITAMLPAGEQTVVDSTTGLLYRVGGSAAVQLVWYDAGGGSYLGSYVLDLGSILAANPGWYSPSTLDLDYFLTPFANKSGGLTRSHLQAAGWGEFDAVTGSYSDWYGLGDMFFWVGNRDRIAQPGQPQAMQWNGHVDYVTCNCSAMSLLVRPPNDGEQYYVK